MRTSIFVLAVGVLSLTGCASTRAAEVREAALQASLKDQSYELPPEKLMAVVRLVLIEQGLTPRDVGVNVVETEASSDSSYGRLHSITDTTRFVASALELNGKTQLSIVEQADRSVSSRAGDSTTRSSKRAHALELEVLRKLDPAKAAAIDAEAERRVEVETKEVEEAPGAWLERRKGFGLGVSVGAGATAMVGAPLTWGFGRVSLLAVPQLQYRLIYMADIAGAFYPTLELGAQVHVTRRYSFAVSALAGVLPFDAEPGLFGFQVTPVIIGLGDREQHQLFLSVPMTFLPRLTPFPLPLVGYTFRFF